MHKPFVLSTDKKKKKKVADEVIVIGRPGKTGTWRHRVCGMTEKSTSLNFHVCVKAVWHTAETKIIKGCVKNTKVTKNKQKI